MALAMTTVAVWIALTVGVVVFALQGIFKWIALCYSVRKAALKLPSFPGHWLYGNLDKVKSLGDMVDLGLVLTAKHKIHVIWLGMFSPIIRVSHPETVKSILSTALPKGGMISGGGGPYRNLLPWLGEGLLCSHGKKWERSRRLLTPAFHFSILKSYVDIFNDAATTMIDVLRKATHEWSKSADVYAPVSNSTLDVMLQSAFSFHDDVQEQGDKHPYVNAMIRLAYLFEQRYVNPIVSNNDLLFSLTKDGREFSKHCRYVHDVADDLITKRRLALKENPDLLQTRHLDFLDILLSARDTDGKGLSHIEIRNEVDTFLFEGHDTTASAISWILYSLAKHQDVQEKVYKEVCEVLGSRTDVLWEDLTKFPYMTQVIKESMRFHTPVVEIMRQLTQPATIDGYKLPTGTIINVSIANLNHNHGVWKNPEEYDPNRFSGDEWNERDPYKFVPFSAGPRNCIGQNFALNEEKVTVARLIHRCKLTLDPKSKAEHYPCIVMRAKEGIKLFIEPR